MPGPQALILTRVSGPTQFTGGRDDAGRRRLGRIPRRAGMLKSTLRPGGGPRIGFRGSKRAWLVVALRGFLV